MKTEEFLSLKEQTLSDINLYITLCSNLDPPPFDYIEKLHNFKSQITISNQAEFNTLHPIWLEIVGDTLDEYKQNQDQDQDQEQAEEQNQ